MDWIGWLTFGFVGTAVLTGILVGAQLARQTRMDLPTMLGTFVTADLDRSRVPGILLHFLNGQVFALVYASAFALIGRSSWLLGAAFGVVHGLLALTLIIPALPAIPPRVHSERVRRSTRRCRRQRRLHSVVDPRPGGCDRAARHPRSVADAPHRRWR